MIGFIFSFFLKQMAVCTQPQSLLFLGGRLCGGWVVVMQLPTNDDMAPCGLSLG